MKTVFGFLLQTEVYSIELPHDVEQEFELVSTAGLSPAAPVSIQVVPQERVDFNSFEWRKSFQAQAAGSRVDVYESPADSKVVMPVWSMARYLAWMELRQYSGKTKSEVLADFLSGLHIDADSFGVPRVRLSGGLVPGNPYSHLTNRDHVIFPVMNGNRRTFVLRFDGALGTDGGVVQGDYARANAATRFGVTVEVSGPSSAREELVAMANAAAGSLELERK